MPDFDLDSQLKQVAGSAHGRVTMPPAAEIRRLGHRRAQRRTAALAGATALIIALFGAVALNVAGEDGDNVADPTPGPTALSQGMLLAPEDFPGGERYGTWVRDHEPSAGDNNWPCDPREAVSDFSGTGQAYQSELDASAMEQIMLFDDAAAAAEAFERTLFYMNSQCLPRPNTTAKGERAPAVGEAARTWRFESRPPDSEVSTAVWGVVQFDRVTVLLREYEMGPGLDDATFEALLAKAVDLVSDPRPVPQPPGPTPTGVPSAPARTPGSIPGWLGPDDLPPVPGLSFWDASAVANPALNAGTGTACEEKLLDDANPNATMERDFAGTEEPGGEPTAMELVGRFSSETAANAFVAAFSDPMDRCAEAEPTGAVAGRATWVLNIDADPNDAFPGRILHMGVARNGTDVVIMHLSYEAMQVSATEDFKKLVSLAHQRLPNLE